MFILSKISDNVRILPLNFKMPKAEALADELNKKFANKVVHNVGLCIRLFDIVHIGEPFVLPNDGSTYTKVIFRMVVFRPFVGEILVGKIRGSNANGVTVTLGFYDDILIPPSHLQDGSHFVQDDQIWYWQVGEDKLFMDLEEEIRIRVSKETFLETMPVVKETNAAEGGGAAPLAVSRQSPYSLIGSINQDGLGLLSWWT